VRALAAAGAALLLASCAGTAGRPSGPPARWVGAAVPAPISRDQLLVAAGAAVWRGDLWAAQEALTALSERERGKPDSALDFWSELLALLRCEPLARVPTFKKGEAPLADPWERLRRLAQIERVRLAREQPEAPRTARWLARQDGPATGAARKPEVVWPVERERWSDEQSVPLLLTRCWPAGAGTAPTVTARPAPATDSEIALVAKTASELPPEHPAAGPLLLQTAVLEMARGRAGEAGAALARFDTVEHLDASTPLQPRERNEAILTAALAAVADPTFAPDLALERGRAVFRLDLPARLRRSLALLLSDRLVAANRPDDAAAILGPPPHGDDAIGRYIAFRQVEAHARRPSGRAPGRSARGPPPTRARRGGRRSGAGRRHGHGPADAAGVAGLCRNDGGPGGARTATRAADPRRGVRRDGAGSGRTSLGNGDVLVALRQ
jgi:hypothetical protein